MAAAGVIAVQRRDCQLNRGATTTTGICPAISGATQYSPCFECPRLVDLSLLNLARSSQRCLRKSPPFRQQFANGTKKALCFLGKLRGVMAGKVHGWRLTPSSSQLPVDTPIQIYLGTQAEARCCYVF